MAWMLMLVIAATAPASAAIPEVDAYRTQLERLQAGTDAVTVEQVFDAATAARRVLLQRAGSQTRLESLSEAEFASVVKTLRGLTVNREEVIVVSIDPVFFRQLAQKHGTAVDREFFRSYTATFPDSVWPSYVRQQTDVTGCVEFGKGDLVRRYGEWTAFRSHHPRAYVAEVREMTEGIEKAVAESKCACGSQKETLAELRRFVRCFPKSPVTGRVRSRITAIRSGRSDIRFHCKSG